MKATPFWFSVVLVLALVGLVAGAWRPQAAASAQAPVAAEASCATGRTVQVSGAAVVNVTPDRALIRLGVQSNGSTPESVQNANFQEIQKVIRAVTALGVDAKDIATDHYIVFPIYENYSALQIKGYRIDNTVSITLREIALVDDVIVAALKVGANEVQDVQFYTSELRRYRDQARELAMKAAGEKARALAGAAGAQVGCVLSIGENTWAQYYGSWRGSRDTALWAQNVIQNGNTAQGGASTLEDSPISLGQIAVRAEVNASYSLK